MTVDFDPTEVQEAIADLAKQIFEGTVDHDRVASIEATHERFDRELWSQLAEANLLGIVAPEAHGGLGLGMTEAALVLREQGRCIAPVPLASSSVAATATIAAFGSGQLANRWIPSLVAGESIVTTAWADYGSHGTPRSSVLASSGDGVWTLSGAKPAVAWFHVAEAVLVPAVTDDGSLTVFCVPTGAPGVSHELNETTNRELHATVRLDGVVVDDTSVVGEPGEGASIVDWVLPRALVAQAAIVLGACEASLAMAAEYTSTREQFGKPLAANQGVALRAADCYIDIEAIRVTLLAAAWAIDNDRNAADRVEVCAYWASEAGQRVVHNTQHLHGGMGADVDYPVHRYFLWVKQFENLLGGSSAHLAELGSSIAARAKATASR